MSKIYLAMSKLDLDNVKDFFTIAFAKLPQKHEKTARAYLFSKEYPRKSKTTYRFSVLNILFS